MPAPYFSVVIPTYNRAHTVRRAIGSVLAQSWRDFELIVVDDGSTDNTAEVVKEFTDPRLRYVWQQNAERCAARNHGAQVAAGTYLIFLDSDDETYPDWLETMAELSGRETANLICCAEDHYDETGRLVRTDVPHGHGPLYGDLTFNYQPGAFAMKRTCFWEIGGYHVDLRCFENSELFVRFSAAAIGANWRIVSSERAVMRICNTGQTVAANPAKVLQSVELFLALHEARFAGLPAKRAQYMVVGAVAASRAGELRRCRRLLRSAIAARPFAWRNYLRLAAACCPPWAKRLWGGEER